jgi:hypothetical protein
VALFALGSCGAPDTYGAPLQHVVLIKLRDPADTGALLADARRHLSAVPDVAELFVGQPFSVGRTGVDLDWDVAVIVGFADRVAYEAYLAHPEHLRFINAWQQRFETIRIHDFEEATVPVPSLRTAVPPAAD